MTDAMQDMMDVGGHRVSWSSQMASYGVSHANADAPVRYLPDVDGHVSHKLQGTQPFSHLGKCI